MPIVKLSFRPRRLANFYWLDECGLLAIEFGPIVIEIYRSQAPQPGAAAWLRPIV